MLRLFFDHIYPYTPILDRVKFCEDFSSDTCSYFVLYAILANIIPYAPTDVIVAAGYKSREAAQIDFAHKARLLHDFGCEKQQLHLLQGSIILSSFQFSHSTNKDHRNWFHNAVRIATQMGLHRQYDLYPPIPCQVELGS
jgi:Fungal specific transcription factor domain